MYLPDWSLNIELTGSTVRLAVVDREATNVKILRNMPKVMIINQC